MTASPVLAESALRILEPAYAVCLGPLLKLELASLIAKWRTVLDAEVHLQRTGHAMGRRRHGLGPSLRWRRAALPAPPSRRRPSWWNTSSRAPKPTGAAPRRR